jgi:hypothetical protein
MSLSLFSISSSTRVGSALAVNKIHIKKTPIDEETVISRPLDLEYSTFVCIYYLSRQSEQHGHHIYTF